MLRGIKMQESNAKEEGLQAKHVNSITTEWIEVCKKNHSKRNKNYTRKSCDGLKSMNCFNALIDGKEKEDEEPNMTTSETKPKNRKRNVKTCYVDKTCKDILDTLIESFIVESKAKERHNTMKERKKDPRNQWHGDGSKKEITCAWTESIGR